MIKARMRRRKVISSRRIKTSDLWYGYSDTVITNPYYTQGIINLFNGHGEEGCHHVCTLTFPNRLDSLEHILKGVSLNLSLLSDPGGIIAAFGRLQFTLNEKVILNIAGSSFYTVVGKITGNDIFTTKLFVPYLLIMPIIIRAELSGYLERPIQ